MSARDTILSRVRANRPEGTHPLPDLPAFPFGEGKDLTSLFVENLEMMGGHAVHGATPGAVLADRFSDARIIASAVPDFDGNRDLRSTVDPRELADVDVAIVRASFGVAETGSVLLCDAALIVNAVAYLAQHLIVVLNPADIVPSLQQAYQRQELHRHRYVVFHTGPSATADIEGVLIHGAQGVRSLTVLISD